MKNQNTQPIGQSEIGRSTQVFKKQRLNYPVEVKGIVLEIFDF